MSSNKIHKAPKPAADSKIKDHVSDNKNKDHVPDNKQHKQVAGQGRLKVSNASYMISTTHINGKFTKLHGAKAPIKQTSTH